MNKPLASHEIAPSASARFTKAEFLTMCEVGAFDNMKIELVRGELERVNYPKSTHSRRQTQILLALHVAVSPVGLVALAETGIDIADETIRGCDVAVVRSMPDLNRHFLPAEILLAIEVSVSTLDRDMGAKRIDYAAAGIANYWVVDCDRKVVHIFREPVDGDYAQVSTTRFGDPIPVPGTDRTITLD